MAEENPSSPPPSGPRRSSFAGQTFADIFGNGRSVPRTSGEADSSSPPTQSGPITQAAAQAQRRRLSLTTLGLSGEGPSRFSTARGARNSLDSANSGSIDESAIEDDFAAPDSSTPSSTAFARRMSFGAKALRDVRGSNGGQGQNGEGFNWSENLRIRAERTSIAGQGGGGPASTAGMHTRAQSVAVMEPPTRALPRESQRPDHFQERILKGDFYMD